MLSWCFRVAYVSPEATLVGSGFTARVTQLHNFIPPPALKLQQTQRYLLKLTWITVKPLLNTSRCQMKSKHAK